MIDWIKFYFIILLCLAVASCAPMPRHPDNNPVRIIFNDELNILTSDKTTKCKYLGTLISSEGHWYTYWFMGNTELVQGAYNDMYNQASAIGANVLYINNNIDFVTSVTLVGQAYNCSIEP